VLDNSGVVSAEIGEGAVVTASKPADTNVNYLDYVQNLRAKVEKIADKGTVTDIEIKCAMPVNLNGEYFKSGKWKLELMPKHDENLSFGNISTQNVVSYEYTYERGGEKYHVYYVFGVHGSFLAQSGYTLSYVCKESAYRTYLPELEKIIDKITFK